MQWQWMNNRLRSTGWSRHSPSPTARSSRILEAKAEHLSSVCLQALSLCQASGTGSQSQQVTQRDWVGLSHLAPQLAQRSGAGQSAERMKWGTEGLRG
mmetsp:Transcript_47954/g.74902  ORF Transcript_47954/g.74902 Transcript_47954/m.74902 type:complete len:98 (+) Transcript_47954:506-799(+)